MCRLQLEAHAVPRPPTAAVRLFAIAAGRRPHHAARPPAEPCVQSSKLQHVAEDGIAAAQQPRSAEKLAVGGSAAAAGSRR